MNRVYVQFGCGLCAPAGWRNFDASPQLRMERCPVIRNFVRKPLFPENCEYGDIVKGLPLASDSCDIIFSSHVLEHLTLQEFRVALTNVFTMLKPGGVFRSVVPDLASAAKNYLASHEKDRAQVFLKSIALGKESRSRSFMGLLRSFIGNTQHLWMWDYEGLESELRKTGFVDIRQAFFGDSLDPMVDRVECEIRWRGSVGFTCVKPMAKITDQPVF